MNPICNRFKICTLMKFPDNCRPKFIRNRIFQKKLYALFYIFHVVIFYPYGFRVTFSGIFNIHSNIVYKPRLNNFFQFLRAASICIKLYSIPKLLNIFQKCFYIMLDQRLSPCHTDSVQYALTFSQKLKKCV